MGWDDLTNMKIYTLAVCPDCNGVGWKESEVWDEYYKAFPNGVFNDQAERWWRDRGYDVIPDREVCQRCLGNRVFPVTVPIELFFTAILRMVVDFIARNEIVGRDERFSIANQFINRCGSELYDSLYREIGDYVKDNMDYGLFYKLM